MGMAETIRFCGSPQHQPPSADKSTPQPTHWRGVLCCRHGADHHPTKYQTHPQDVDPSVVHVQFFWEPTTPSVQVRAPRRLFDPPQGRDSLGSQGRSIYRLFLKGGVRLTGYQPPGAGSGVRSQRPGDRARHHLLVDADEKLPGSRKVADQMVFSPHKKCS